MKRIPFIFLMFLLALSLCSLFGTEICAFAEGESYYNVAFRVDGTVCGASIMQFANGTIENPPTDKSEAFAKTGYNLIGYSFLKDGTSVTISLQDFTEFQFNSTNLGSTYSFGGTIYFDCVYEAQDRTITFDIPSSSFTIMGEKITLTATQEPKTVKYDQVINIGEIDIPEIDHYVFEGWYTDNIRTERFISKKVDGDFTLYAKYTRTDAVVTFKYGSASLSYNVFAPFGEIPTPPIVPDMGQKTFDTWDKELAAAKDGDTYTAVYRNIYEYRYVANGFIVRTYATRPTNAPTPPEVEGMTFVGYDEKTDDDKLFIFTAEYEPNLYEIDADYPAYLGFFCSPEPRFGSEITVNLSIPNGTTFTKFTIDGEDVMENILDGKVKFRMPAHDVKIVIEATNNSIGSGNILIPDTNGEKDTASEDTKGLDLMTLISVTIGSVALGFALIIIVMYHYKKNKRNKYIDLPSNSNDSDYDGGNDFSNHFNYWN